MAREIKLSDSTITFRNLAGRPTDWNKKGGVRDFAVVIENQEVLDMLVGMGFNVKQFNKKNENDPDSFYLKVKVNFKFNDEGKLQAPLIYIINGKTKSKPLTPGNVEIVDRANIDYCDILITPYYCEVKGVNYVSAYLSTMYVNIKEDPFEEKYSMYEDDSDEEMEEIPFE